MVKTIGIICTSVVIGLLYANFIDLLYALLGTGSAAYEWFFLLIVAPVWEELLYRYFPLHIAKKLGNEYIVPTIIASSILFGWGHEGGTHEGVLLQGVLGVIFSIAYIKSGYKIYVPILIHFLYNLLV